MQTKYKVVLLLFILLPVVSTTAGMEVVAADVVQSETFQISQTPDAVYIEDVPYVWQEVNGYCMSAALSMVVQSMGMDLTLHDLFSAMGTGFSAMYIGMDSARNFYPGVLIQQPIYLEFFSEIYGLDMTRYLDMREPFGYHAAYMFEATGVDYFNYENSTISSPFNVLRETLSSGIPLAVAVDPYYLPPDDYDDFRRYGAPLDANGVSHAITVVGYNDTSEEIYIQDPGVGLFEDNYGYPDDGRWNYTMSYFNFNKTWQKAGYLTFKVTQETSQVEDFEERLGEFILERLRGDRTHYFEGIENFYYLSPGQTAFSGLGLDLTVDCIADFARYFQEVNKADVLYRLGHITEMFLTVQYHGYHHGLDTIQDILPGVDLTDFIEAADDAIPHFEALTSNESVQTIAEPISRDTLIFSTFEDIAEDFRMTGNLEGSIGNHQDRLDEIRTHLFAIANSWGAAADALEVALDLPDDAEPLDGSMPVVIGGSVVIVLAVAICIFRRRK